MPRGFLGVGVLALVLFVGCSDSGPDGTPPGQVQDLSLIAADETTATVTWTAPGNNGTEGRATEYDLRSWLPEGSWDAGTRAPTLTPKTPGQVETTRVGGLTPDLIYSLALETLDEAGNRSIRSNAVEVETGDPAPPSQITDLRLSNPWPHAVTLVFTAPGDDGDQGRVESYEVRMAPVEITETTWESAEVVEVDQEPKEAGFVESIRVTDLVPETQYHFAVRGRDNAGKLGPVSNDFGETLPADTYPPNQITNLTVKEIGITTVILSWTAPGNDRGESLVPGYNLRYALAEITEATWDQAVPVPGPEPKNPGETESWEVTGLPGHKTIWFAVRTTDEAGNESELSPSPSALVPDFPKTWEVRVDGTGDAPTIQAAVDSCERRSNNAVGAGPIVRHRVM